MNKAQPCSILRWITASKQIPYLSQWLYNPLLNHYIVSPLSQKSRSARLLGCKRPHNGSLSLPIFAIYLLRRFFISSRHSFHCSSSSQKTGFSGTPFFAILKKMVFFMSATTRRIELIVRLFADFRTAP